MFLEDPGIPNEAVSLMPRRLLAAKQPSLRHLACLIDCQPACMPPSLPSSLSVCLPVGYYVFHVRFKWFVPL